MVTGSVFSIGNEEILGDNWLVAPIRGKVAPIGSKVASIETIVALITIKVAPIQIKKIFIFTISGEFAVFGLEIP